MSATEQQEHLTKREMINLGSYYTKPHLVDMVFDLIHKNIPINLREYTILDSSCGYGSFFDNKNIKDNKKIGADIDKQALAKARQNLPTLIIRNSIKGTSVQDKIDSDIKTRNLGIMI